MSASLSEPPAPPLTPPGTANEVGEQRSGTALAVLTILVNLAFALLATPIAGLSALNTDISSVNDQEVSSGWYLLWPGMLVAWGAAWIGFAVYARLQRTRAACTAFLLIAGAWLLPMVLYAVSLCMSA